MFVETATHSPAHFSGEIPDDVARNLPSLPALGADNLRRTLLAEMRPAAVLCGAMWAAAFRRQLAELDRGDRRFAFYTLDVLREEELAGWVQVRVLPTTLIVQQGRIVTRFAGFTPRRIVHSALAAAAFPRCA